MASSEFCETVMRDEEYFVISFRHRTPQEVFAIVTLNSVALYKVKFKLFLVFVLQNTIAYVGPFQYVPRYAVFNDPSARTLREMQRREAYPPPRTSKNTDLNAIPSAHRMLGQYCVTTLYYCARIRAKFYRVDNCDNKERETKVPLVLF